MSVIDFIENLQQKPRQTRIQIMWTGVILSSVVIFAFWLWSLTSLLANSTNSKESAKSLQSLNEIKKEMPGLWQSLSAGIANVINTAKEELNSSPSVTPAADDFINGQNNQPELIERLPIE